MRVAIVGAGITGLYLSWKLAEKGHEVSVFEKKEKIGKEVCSGLFSERILEFIPPSENLIQNRIDFVLIHFPKKTLKIQFSEKFYVMSHFELDNLVANLAENTGAKIAPKHNVTQQDWVTLQKFDPVRSFLNIDPEENYLATPLTIGASNGVDRIIGCDGANSIVRKNLNLPEPHYYSAIQGFLPKEDFSNFVETWPTKSGFLWKIPRGKEIEYGIIGEPKTAKDIFKKFLEENIIYLQRFTSAIVPQGLIIPSNPKITLCGDAAGLTKPWSGGGVIWSLLAAEILLKNFPDFIKYKKELKNFFLPKIMLSKAIKKTIYFMGFNTPWLLPKNFKIEGDFLITSEFRKFRSK